MKIAVTSAFLGKVLRGCETWSQDLAAELHRRGMDVTLFQGGGPSDVAYARYIPCPDHTHPFWKYMTTLTRHGLWRYGLGSPLHLQQAVFGRRVARELRDGRFDIIHTQDAGTALVLERARNAGRHPAKVILANGTEEPFEFLSQFEHVQELAPYYLETDRKNGLSPDREWFAIPNFVDCEVYKPGNRAQARQKFGIPQDRFIVFDAAALKLTHKRLDWLAREVATARREYPEIMLIVAGAVTSETPRVEQAVHKHLGEDAWILKNVPRCNMPDLYRTADLFAHSALTEMFAIVLLEAGATGLPLRGHKFPVIEWVIGTGGVCVDMEKPGELARSIIESLEDPVLRAQRGSNARDLVVKQFDKIRVVDQIVAMYEAVLKRR
ncbi:MAG TPA: glycosyltransferase family 4 protein [Verrucomicrobiae bacterium]|nr:glycosyltransferase family 4 protein [Verrucomicrobiae bacterium]